MRPILRALAVVLLSAATSVAIAQSALPWANPSASPAGSDVSPGETLATDAAQPAVRAAVVYPEPDESQMPAVPVSRLAQQPIQQQPTIAATVDPQVTPTVAAEPASRPEPTAAPAVASAIPSHPITDPVFYPDPENFQEQGGMFGLMMYQESATQPGVPSARTVGPRGSWSMGGRSAGGDDSFALPDLSSAPAVQVVGESEIKAQAPTDMAAALQASSSVDTVKVQRRSPISQDPHIRGYKYGQIYTQADGVYWTPARLDLDTMLSKIDPNMVQEVEVIPGPYGLRYGPGFAFINVTRAPTPRSACGIVQDYDTTFDTRTNGGQVNLRETVSGGGEDWGYRFSYGARKGSDYRAGNDLKIPSSYESQDVWGEFSYDLNSHQRLDFAFQRLDQTDTEYPAQFFDLSFLGTYGFQATLTDDSPYGPWDQMAVSTWYNRTWFSGNADQKGARNDFPVMQRVDAALTEEFGQDVAVTKATTQGAGYSSGARGMATFGDPREDHVNLGADFRYLGQKIGEHFETTAPDPNPNFDTNMPRAWLFDPGVFAEWSTPMSDIWKLSVGTRVDSVRTTARASELRPDGNLIEFEDELTQNDFLYAFYLTNEVEMNEHWMLTGGFGYSQRPPSLVERYADGLFLSLAQSGFDRFIGTPTLDYERNWQADIGVTGEFEAVRVRANAFHAWVLDYITWQDETVQDPTMDARLITFVNTPLATLTGFDLSAEYDLSARVTSFGQMSYIDGRDRTIDAPLPAISPLDTRLGLRWHDLQKGRRWGVEMSARLVLQQDRLGSIRQEGSDELVRVESLTPGFTVWDLRTYWNYTDKLRLFAGIDNLFDATYQEHLDLRLWGPSGVQPAWTRVYEPGITPYFGVNWIF